MNCSKFFSPQELLPIIQAERQKHKTIALANGCFDLIHVGHIRYLIAAKQLTDILIVALNSDHSIKGLKGKNRALFSERGRIKIISALGVVDYVTMFDDPTVEMILRMIKPDIHCKGSDYTPETVPEREIVKEYGGRIAIVGGEKVCSTSAIIKELKKR